MKHLILYGKPDCHLCHEAREMLVALQREYEFTLHEVDITNDPTLEQQYRYAIPVVVIDSRLELAAPIHESELRAALR
ncbi:MAG: glutaredoxin family protein [Chloroflexi bacterium]|nr:glutaredoxin family protein [Chloroflexota bacterium]